MEHKKLVTMAKHYLTYRESCCVVFTEFVCATPEIPDALGWKSNGNSILIECKTSKADFKKDKDKPVRVYPTMGMGDKRYFLCPSGIISPEELPQGWGLLYADKKNIRIIQESDKFETTKQYELVAMISMVRRFQKFSAVYVVPEAIDQAEGRE